MNSLERYSKSVRKKTEKLLKKLFGYSDLKTALHDLNSIRFELEQITGKDVNDIIIQDVRVYPNGCYEYVKFRTLKKITDIYLDFVSLGFHSNELEEYKNEC